MKRLMTLCLGMLALAAAAGPLPAGDEIVGIWKTFDKHGQQESSLEIYKENEKYCARVASLTESNWPADDDQKMGGQPKNDRYNPDASLRQRPIIGLQIMRDLAYNPGKQVWEGGRIYDPASGKTYRCKFKFTSPTELEARGYVGISLLGRTEIWRR